MFTDKRRANLNKARIVANKVKSICQYCKSDCSKKNLKRHEATCYANPANTKYCVVCGDIIIKEYRRKVTCSYACSNKHFRSGPNNPNWRESNYTTTCFHYHKKECVVCGETNIVAVHHLDENHHNNSPENLIPLCPTHHQYWHSRFKHLVEPQVMTYITEWKKTVVSE